MLGDENAKVLLELLQTALPGLDKVIGGGMEQSQLLQDKLHLIQIQS